MEDTTQIIENLLIKTNEYGRTTYRLLLLKAIDKISDNASSVLPTLILILTIAYFLLFLNIGIAIYLGEVLGNNFYGFFAVAGFYLVMSTVIHLFLRSWIKRQFHDALIDKMN